MSETLTNLDADLLPNCNCRDLVSVPASPWVATATKMGVKSNGNSVNRLSSGISNIKIGSRASTVHLEYAAPTLERNDGSH